MRSNSRAIETTAEMVSHRDLLGKELYLPAGLLGFPACSRYRLECFDPGAGDESPFLMLNSLDQDLSFPLIHPDSIGLHYQFTVNAELLTLLRASLQIELVPLLIVTVRERLEDITVNLQGPLVVNPTSALGFQLVIEEYPLRYPLLNSAAG